MAHARRKTARNVSAAFADVFCLKVVNMLPEVFQHLRLDLAEVATICVKDSQNFPVVWQDDRSHLPLPYLREFALWVFAVVVVRAVLIERGAVFCKRGLDGLPCTGTI